MSYVQLIRLSPGIFPAVALVILVAIVLLLAIAIVIAPVRNADGYLIIV
jgi:hypothetical protein